MRRNSMLLSLGLVAILALSMAPAAQAPVPAAAPAASSGAQQAAPAAAASPFTVEPAHRPCPMCNPYSPCPPC